MKDNKRGRKKITEYNAQTRAKQKYNDKHYDKIYLSVPKGEKDRLKKEAQKNNKSLNKFIVDIILYYIEGDED